MACCAQSKQSAVLFNILIFQIYTMSNNPGPRTRTSSDHFLVGQEQSDLGQEARQGKLPLTKDIMKYFF